VTEKLTPKFEIDIEGSPAPAEVVEKVIAISVRQDLHLAESCEIKLANDDLRFSDGDTFVEGKTISIKLGYTDGDLTLVGKGTIARREIDFPERGGSVVTVVAYDKRFALKKAVKNKTWTDVKDSDVVSEIASNAGLTADVDTTTDTHKYLFQKAQTDLSFIAERALKNGYLCSIDRDSGKLSFKKPDTGDAAGVTLAWGKDLFLFRPRFTSAEQVNEVTVRGWDMASKKMVSGKATPDDLTSKMGLDKIGADSAKKAYGARSVLLPTAASTADEATDFAKSVINQAAHAFGTGQGACQGDTRIDAGTVVEIDGVGKRASGKYYVTSTLHHYEPRGYTTFFDYMRPGDSPTPAPPPEEKKPAAARDDGPKAETFIEYNLVGLGVAVVEGTEYTVTLPNGSKKTGKVDATKKIRVEGITDPGQCKIELKLQDGHKMLGGDGKS